MMSVLYNYTKADGSITNSPYEYDANGMQTASNQYQGRADGLGTGAVAAAIGAGNPNYGYSINDGSSPMQMPAASNAQLGGSAGGGYGSSTYGPNPYLASQASSIQALSNQNLQQNVLPGIRSSALGNGSFGGSRQGIAEGVAAGNAATGVAAAQAGLYANGYNTDQANQTARIGLSNNYNLGMGGLQNNAVAQNQNFYSQQRGQDLTQYQLGSSLYGGGINGQAGVGAGQYQTGQTAQQAPYTALQQYSNGLTPYTGLNSAQQQQVAGPGLVNSALGGALAGGQIGKNLGMSGYSGNNAQASFSQTGLGSSGFGTGLAYGNQDYGSYI